MNRSEVFRTVLDAISDFTYPEEDLMVDSEGQITELALSLARTITDALDGEI